MKQGYIIICMCLIIVLTLPEIGLCGQQLFDKVEKPVAASISIRQKTQTELDKWEKKKIQLIAEYERLKQEEAFLDKVNKNLIAGKSRHENNLKSLVLRRKESLKIQKDMLPFLCNAVSELKDLISQGLPFLKEERETRLEKLEKIINDPDTGVAEKYRKTMEALFIEAGYGDTSEVLCEKIDVSGHEVLENVLRLGRISLFALSLDHKSAAYFNIIQNKWLVLDKKYIKPVYSAMEISRKRRTAELVSLPIGRLEAKP